MPKPIGFENFNWSEAELILLNAFEASRIFFPEFVLSEFDSPEIRKAVEGLKQKQIAQEIYGTLRLTKKGERVWSHIKSKKQNTDLNEA